jgi:hypothetical protein
MLKSAMSSFEMLQGADERARREISMGDRRAFGPSRSAAGIKDKSEVVLARPNRRRVRRRLGGDTIERKRVAGRRSDADPVPDALNVGAYGLQEVKVIVRGDYGADPGVVEDGSNLAGVEPEVYRHNRRARFQDAELGDLVLVTILGQDSDPVARRNAESNQRVGDSIRGLVELAIGKPRCAENQGLPAGIEEGASCENVTDEHG